MPLVVLTIQEAREGSAIVFIKPEDAEGTMNMADVRSLVRDAASEWSNDNASRLAAAVAYYTVFSIAPLLVIILAIIGFVWSSQEAQNRLMDQLGGAAGGQVASFMKTIVQQRHHPGSGIIATVVGFIVLLFGASGVFYELTSSLNTVWAVQTKSQGWLGIIKKRLPSFFVIPVIGLLLLVALSVSAAIPVFAGHAGSLFHGMTYLFQVSNFVLFFFVVGLLFALLYKMLPDVKIEWSDVWPGAGVAAFLFSVGKLAIGIYLGRSAISTTYGAAGSLVILLAWVYYSAQIFFFGAEFVQIYANRYGSLMRPSEGAEPLRSLEPEVSQRPYRQQVEKRQAQRQDGGEVRDEGRGRALPLSAHGQTPETAKIDGQRSTTTEKVRKDQAERPSLVVLSSFLGGLVTGFFLWRPHKSV